MIVVLREGSARDVAGLAAILGGWIDETPWMPKLHSSDDHLHFLRRLVGAGGVRVADADGTPVGFLSRDGSEIAALYPLAAVRRQGIGAALLQEAQTSVAALHLWTFQANAGAQRFYARHGFVEVGRGAGADNDEGLPDLRLSWRRPL